MDPDLWTFEKEARAQGYSSIAGVDEAGRGPLAGPVVSSAVVLPVGFVKDAITDSKKLSPKKRDYLYDKIYAEAVSIGTGIVDAPEIDRINILQASLLSMAMAVDNLYPVPDFLLIDGIHRPPCRIPHRTIPKGDARSVSIAAASIVAKVSRDRMMERYHLDYPRFEFSKNKGYPTKTHKTAIRKYGYCPIHRRSFRGVKEHLNKDPLFG